MKGDSSGRRREHREVTESFLLWGFWGLFGQVSSSPAVLAAHPLESFFHSGAVLFK